jgi:hypothetical protein
MLQGFSVGSLLWHGRRWFEHFGPICWAWSFIQESENFLLDDLNLETKTAKRCDGSSRQDLRIPRWQVHKDKLFVASRLTN